jgi:hypothetical protein
MGECCRIKGGNEPVHLPCAGITLIRFYGYFSASPGLLKGLIVNSFLRSGLSTPRTLSRHLGGKMQSYR